MEMQKFESKTAMLEFLKTLKAKDHYRIAGEHGFRPRNHSEAWLLTDYLVQGINSGLTGEALQAYAKEKAERLVAIMPHLARDSGDMAVDAEPVPVEFQLAPIPTASAESVASQGAPVMPAPKVAKAPKAPKAPKARKRHGVKYADFTIIPRPDRGGFDGWYGGRAEAFRPTAEKVSVFFQKKYGQPGVLDGVVVSAAVVAKEPKVAKAPKEAKVSKVKKRRGTKYADFTIVPRPDRGGFDGWYGGRAEAFRATVEKVSVFFQKKYGQPGVLLGE